MQVSMDELVRAAKGLSDPTRVRVLNLLMQRECCVCEVMQVLGISQVNASRYCNGLKDAGFLKMRKEGRWKHYSVVRDNCSATVKQMLDAVRQTAKDDAVCVDDRRRLASAMRRSDFTHVCAARIPGSALASQAD
jgi:ArsR family transcriptional regulator